jgi:hypothetical protein
MEETTGRLRLKGEKPKKKKDLETSSTERLRSKQQTAGSSS